MANPVKEVKDMGKLPTRIGFNKGTLGLMLLSFISGVFGSWVLNRFDNKVTRNLNAIKAGQNPVGI